MSALKSVDSLDTDLEDILSKFTNVVSCRVCEHRIPNLKDLLLQMHITKTAASEPRIMCEATKKELIPDLEEVKNHVNSAQFKESMQEMKF